MSPCPSVTGEQSEMSRPLGQSPRSSGLRGCGNESRKRKRGDERRG